MGFYGNITNVSKNNLFTFDKTYANRQEMETNMNSDGVYVGRYVLIDYDQIYTNSDFLEVYAKDGEDTYLYTTAENQEDTKRVKDLIAGAVVYVDAKQYDKGGPYAYYYCTGKDDDGYNTFEYIDSSITNQAYTSGYRKNYMIDQMWGQQQGYENIGRGWDSTVWQKVYENGVEKYVMIAELNSVVPTFDITADAPSTTPIPPHFDELSTDTYYKLHQQGSWGMRVKPFHQTAMPVYDLYGNKNTTGNTIYSPGVASSSVETPDGIVKGVWEKTEYDIKNKVYQTYWYNTKTNDWDTYTLDSEATNIYGLSASCGVYKVLCGENRTFTQVDGITEENFIENTWYKTIGSSYSLASTFEENVAYYSVDFPYNIDQAIYWNPNGFDKALVNYDSETDSAFGLSPTGYSGHSYESHAGTSETPQVDTQEFYAMLPEIGNAISDMWDVVYGGKAILSQQTYDPGEGKVWGKQTVQTEDKTIEYYYRSLDVDWDSTKGIRAVAEASGDQYTFDTSNLATLAGSINSVHDLMGMIITSESAETDATNGVDLDDPDQRKIYYNNGKFYRIKTNFIYELGENNSSVAKTSRIVENLKAYQKDTYYYKQQFDWVLATKDYPLDNFKYYTIDPDEVFTQVDVSETYFPNTYYYYNSNVGKYFLETDSNYSDIKSYSRFTNETSDHSCYFYKANSYYYLGEDINPSDAEEDDYILDEGETPTQDRQYYLKVSYSYWDPDTRTSGDAEVLITVPTDELYTIAANKFYVYNADELSFKLLSVDDLEVIANRIINGDYLDEDKTKASYTCRIPTIQANIKFYQASKYYYLDGTTYKLDTDTHIVLQSGEEVLTLPADRQYLRMIQNPTPVSETFYEPNRYYLDETCNTLATGAYDSSKTYYEWTPRYVYDDSLGVYAMGSLWNESVEVPDTVVLATREECLAPEELVGFARTLNTIHGLILKINLMLESGDLETRDNQTVQGCINLLNDIIAKFASMEPSDVMVVDAYGRVHGADQTSQQLYQYTNIGKPSASASNVSNEEDEFILWDVDDDVNNPKITLKHQMHTVADTTTTADKNTDGTTKDGLNKAHGDTIDLYTPIVDNMGHVVGKNTETVTLPYGFKTVKTNGVGSTTTNMTTATNDVVAENTQDTFTINSHDKWIRLATDASADSITIAHEIHSVDTTPLTSDINGNGDTLTIQDTEYDIAGHITLNKKHTYTLPYGFKTITTNGRETKDNTTTLAAQSNIVADNTQDTLAINSGNEWVKIETDATNDKITISHDVKTTSTSTSSASLSSEENKTITFDIPTYSFDATNHYAKHDTKTLTMPFGYGKFTGDTGDSAARATYDTFAINGDTWVVTKAETDKIGFTHSDPHTTAAPSISNETPAFGSTFTIQDWSFDNKGHKANGATHTVKIPQGSLTDKTANGADVITQLSFAPTTGALSSTRTNIGNLKLTDYTLGSDSSKIAATDTLNAALSKVQVNLDTIDSRINTAISNLVDGAPTTFDTLKEISDWINGDGVNATELTSAITRAINTEAASRESADDALSDRLDDVEELLDTYGDIVTHNASEFATSAQGETADTALQPEDAPGYDDILTTTVAATTYQEKLTAGIDYVEPSAIESMITSDTTFTSTDEDLNGKTLNELIEIIAGLKARIVTLEGYHTTE